MSAHDEELKLMNRHVAKDCEPVKKKSLKKKIKKVVFWGIAIGTLVAVWAVAGVYLRALLS